MELLEELLLEGTGVTQQGLIILSGATKNKDFIDKLFILNLNQSADG